MAPSLSSLGSLKTTFTSTKLKLLNLQSKRQDQNEVSGSQSRYRLAPFEPCYSPDGKPYWSPWPTETNFSDQASSYLAGRLPTEILLRIWRLVVGPVTQEIHMLTRWVDDGWRQHAVRCDRVAADEAHKCEDYYSRTPFNREHNPTYKIHPHEACFPGIMDNGAFSLICSCRKL